MKKKVIRNNTVGPLLVFHLCFGKRGEKKKKKQSKLYLVVLQIRELEVCTVAEHHGSLPPPRVVSLIDN